MVPSILTKSQKWSNAGRRMHYPSLVAALNFFAAAVIFRSSFQHFESRYQGLIFVVIAVIVELSARTVFQRAPSLVALLLFISASFLGIIMTKWAIEGLPWWLYRWFL
jgi:hypothetical protein